MTQLAWLQQHGVRRRSVGRARFRYVGPKGRPVPRSLQQRIEALKIPPAWRDVAVHPRAQGKLQAVGRDAKGRWQYLYHPAFVRKQTQAKYQRLMRFAQSLPALRRRLRKDLSSRGLGRDRVMACILRILSTCFVRPGSAVYAEENGSFGLATLRRKHVRVVGDRLILDFPGKSGQKQHRELKDARVARIVRALLKSPGAEVFKFCDESGAFVDVRRRHINAYIKEVMGESFTAKDFRTWAGTLICACALARAGFDNEDTQHARRKKVVEAVKATAQELGNTPSVCRSSYIYPSVLSSFDKGRVVGNYVDDVEELATHHAPKFHASEKALLKLLKQDAAASV